jgi:hypothetical protein
VNFDPNAIPLLASIVIAALGSIGGFAALMKVNADNSDTIADGASKVVTMMNERMDDTEARVDALEEYAYHFDNWADKLVSLVDRAIALLPLDVQKSFRHEADEVRQARPRRPTTRRK